MSATNLFLSTLLNYVLGLFFILVMHLCALGILHQRYPDVEVPKLLRFPRLEFMFIFHTVQGLVLSAVTGIKMSCTTSVKGISVLVVVVHLALAILLAWYIRKGIGSHAIFEYFLREHRAELVASVSGHLRQVVTLPPRSSAASKQAGKEEPEAGVCDSVGSVPEAGVRDSTGSVQSAKSSGGSRRRPKVHLGKVRDAYKAYKETKQELAGKGIDGAVLNKQGKWIFANEGVSAAAPTEKENVRDSVSSELSSAEFDSALTDVPSEKGSVTDINISPGDGDVVAAREKAAAARFQKRFSFFFEDYIGECWWFGLVIIAEKLLTAIIAPALGAGTGPAQPFLLFLVQAVHLGFLIRFMPFTSYADNFNGIITKLSHVLTYFTFLGAAISMATHDAEKAASYVGGAAALTGFIQVVATIHLMIVQLYVIYEKVPPGFTKSVFILCVRIFKRRSKTEADDKASQKQRIEETKGSAKMLEAGEAIRSDKL